MTSGILLMSDASLYGGHEQVCVDFAKYAQDFCDVQFAISSKNTELSREIRRSLNISPLEMNIKYRRFGSYLGSFFLDHRFAAHNAIRRYPNHTVILMQGRIETSVPFMVQLSSEGRIFHSIIPFAHALADIKGPGIMRSWEDIHRQTLYRLPSSYIVPSSTAERQLRAQRVSSKIQILPNLAYQPSPSRNNRRTIVRCIGRIEFRQKQQDLIVRLIAKNPSLFRGIEFQFAGQGPDSENLTEMIRRSNLGNICRYIGSLPRESLLDDTSAVIMPSKFEGVPLVMLEALSAGVPFIGSDIDIFSEYLPGFSICRFETPEDLLSVIEDSISASRSSEWQDVRDKVRYLHGEATFSTKVSEILTSLLGV